MGATPQQSQQPQVPANATGLPDALRSGMENLSGQALADVRVVYNSSEPAKVGAKAYTQGNVIHLGPGQEMQLAHEAWHAVQQKQGRVSANTRINGSHVNDNPALEKEADTMAARFASAV